MQLIIRQSQSSSSRKFSKVRSVSRGNHALDFYNLDAIYDYKRSGGFESDDPEEEAINQKELSSGKFFAGDPKNLMLFLFN